MSKCLPSPLNETTVLFSPQVLKCVSLQCCNSVVNSERRGCSATSVLTSSSFNSLHRPSFFFFNQAKTQIVSK